MNRSKTNIPIKVFRFPKACKRLKIKQDESRQTLSSPNNLLSPKRKNSSQNFSDSSLFIKKTENSLTSSKPNLTIADFYSNSFKKPLITITAAKKPEKKELFSCTTENFAKFFSKKKKLLLKKIPKKNYLLNSVVGPLIKCDLNQSFKVIKQNFNIVHKTKESKIESKPKKRIHAWIPQTQSFESIL